MRTPRIWCYRWGGVALLRHVWIVKLGPFGLAVDQGYGIWRARAYRLGGLAWLQLSVPGARLTLSVG